MLEAGFRLFHFDQLVRNGITELFVCFGLRFCRYQLRICLCYIGFDQAEITAAKISKNDIAKITVKFVSEQVNLLKNKDDEIIEGDENFIQNITDVWTFERCLTSTNPNWLLVSTKK